MNLEDRLLVDFFELVQHQQQVEQLMEFFVRTGVKYPTNLPNTL
jgi:hypothetical protein